MADPGDMTVALQLQSKQLAAVKFCFDLLFKIGWSAVKLPAFHDEKQEASTIWFILQMQKQLFLVYV
jgi:hypothetical protein